MRSQNAQGYTLLIDYCDDTIYEGRYLIMPTSNLPKIANEIRLNIIEALHASGSGHPGGSLSAADILACLYYKEMNIDPSNPNWPARDRFVLSKGHAAPALYSVLSMKGYFTHEELLTLRKMGSFLQGHPDMKHTPGIDISTGSLGQGISAATGMALSAKLFGDDFRVYTLVGDGEIQEGQVWEAAMFAGSNHLDNLVVFVDNNNLQIDGTIEDVNSPYPIPEKFLAFNFHVITLENGHDTDAICAALDEARTVKGKPTCIICKTTKGKGISFMENQVGWHGRAMTEEEYMQAKQDLEKAGEA